MKYADGSVYKGKFDKDKRHGKGLMKWSDGSEYDGYWFEDIRHGLIANEQQGKYTWNTKTSYIGDWVHGKREGNGKM